MSFHGLLHMVYFECQKKRIINGTGDQLIILNTKREAVYPWVELLVNSCWLIIGLMAHDGLAKKKKRLSNLRKMIGERQDQAPGNHPNLNAAGETVSNEGEGIDQKIAKVEQNLFLVKIKSWREIIDWHMSLYACFRSSFSSTSYMEGVVGSIGVMHGLLGLYRLSLKFHLDDNWLHSES